MSRGRTEARSLRSLEGTEWIAFKPETLAEWMQAMVEQFGESPAYAIIYHVSSTMGRRMFYQHLDEAKSKDPKAVLEVFARRKRCANWGRFSFHNLDTQAAHVTVRVHNSLDRKVGALRIKDCIFTKGYLNGFFSQMFDTPTTITETHVNGLCEFHVEAKKNG